MRAQNHGPQQTTPVCELFCTCAHLLVPTDGEWSMRGANGQTGQWGRQALPPGAPGAHPHCWLLKTFGPETTLKPLLVTQLGKSQPPALTTPSSLLPALPVFSPIYPLPIMVSNLSLCPKREGRDLIHWAPLGVGFKNSPREKAKCAERKAIVHMVRGEAVLASLEWPVRLSTCSRCCEGSTGPVAASVPSVDSSDSLVATPSQSLASLPRSLYQAPR